jgi:Big-like domain-containing protein
VRRLAATLLLAGCAQPGMPPGGPTDKVPPRLVRVTPDTNAVNVRGGAISFQFDEVVSERPKGAGIATLADLFIVSPSRGPNGVSWRRTRVDITPRGGLRPNTTYTVQMLPGMVDLDDNIDSTGMTLTFSTGPSLATGRIAGRVFDWIAARPAPRAVVAAISLPDSARFATETDSSGAFTITHLPAGTFLLRALLDGNRNGVVDARELFDTVTVTLADTLRREMLTAVRDSFGPGIATADRRDSLTLRLTFDRPLDTLLTPRPTLFVVQAADSSVVAIDTVFTQADVDRRMADSVRTKAIQDSVRRAFVTDSTRRADSARVAAAPPTPTAAAPPTRPTGRRPGATNRAPPVPPRDTSERIVPKPSVRIPVTVLYLKFATALKPGTAYRVTTDSLPSIAGAKRSSSRVFTTPRPAARPDTGAVRPDTGRANRG